jgi:hypothetical protein
VKKDKKFIWDYDIKTLNLKDKKAMEWYLVRKIEFGDWASLDRETLARFLPSLQIHQTMKNLLQLFLHENPPQRRTEKVSRRISKK